jgi:hypothetical protein
MNSLYGRTEEVFSELGGTSPHYPDLAGKVAFERRNAAFWLWCSPRCPPANDPRSHQARLSKGEDEIR